MKRCRDACNILKFEFLRAATSSYNLLYAPKLWRLIVNIWDVTYLFVKFNEGWFEEGTIILGTMVWILLVAQTFAHFILWLEEVSLNLSWKGM